MRFFLHIRFLILAACAPPAGAAADLFAVVDGAIPAPLTQTPGSAAEGRKVMVGKALGNCIACHQLSAFKTEQFQGEMGPPLDGVAERWSEAQLRLIVANAKLVFPDTIMPAFYRSEGLNRVRPEYLGKTILSAQQVEDVVAFLTPQRK